MIVWDLSYGIKIIKKDHLFVNNNIEKDTQTDGVAQFDRTTQYDQRTWWPAVKLLSVLDTGSQQLALQ